MLVTGAAGFVGSHICERLVELGHEVWGLDAFIPYYPEDLKARNLEGLLKHQRFRLWRLDLRSDDLTDCLRGVDAVVNEAAMPGLPRSWTDLELYTSCNVVGLGRLLQACRDSEVRRFVHASTSSVYGAEAVGDEQLPTRPSSPYGITKLAAEHLLAAYGELSSFEWIILRYFSIYGPRQRPDMAYNIFIDALSQGRPITIYGDGLQTRSSTYVADCVNATILALTRGSSGDTYNIGGGEAITLLDAIDIIGDALGVDPEIAFAESRAGDQRHTAADISRARAVLTYEPSVVPQVGLPKQVEWQVASPSASVTSVSD